VAEVRLPISVFIIAKDEADRIPHTIQSVRDWVSEVIVIDSGSQDDTVAVSESLDARVVFHAWEGYGPQKNYGESLCEEQWLLNLDADEAVSDGLREEITALFAKGEPPKAGYHLPIRIVFPFDNAPRPFAPSNSPIRLYHRQKGAFKPALVHDSVILNTGEKAGSLRHPVYHRCFRSYHHAVAKINRYSSMQAEDMLAKGRKPPAWRIIMEPAIAFLKSYVLRRYCLFGLNGFIESTHYAYARFLRLAKAHEAWQKKEKEIRH
jgi:glycosyltransferase involved in cell wall biosynthesis